MPNEYRSRTRDQEDLALYVFARCEQFIEDYARSHSINASELATRVAGLLSAQTGGQPLGSVDHLSALRGQTGTGSISVAEVAVAGRSHNGASRPRTKPHAGSVKAGGDQSFRQGQPRGTVNEDRIKEIRGLAAKGLGFREIAEKIGITSSGVAYYGRKHKIKITHHDTGGKPIQRRVYTRKNPHWTQLPENAARVQKWARKMRRLKG